ncbi:MAG: nitroreductase family protein [Endomicrobiales bacterium]|nr:nitroreductase family protein [Endomicrobiales bacterium]
MAELDRLITSRRSIRNYLDKPVEKGKIQEMIEAVRLAPSACNSQPWRLIIVDEKDLKNELAKKGLGGVVSNAWAKTAPVIIVACSDLSFFTHKIGEKVQGVQYHLIDMGIALEHMVLKAAELSLGTCYIGWFNSRPIKQILNIPSSWSVDCLVTLGYPAEIPEATSRKSTAEIAFYNKID